MSERSMAQEGEISPSEIKEVVLEKLGVLSTLLQHRRRADGELIIALQNIDLHLRLTSWLRSAMSPSSSSSWKGGSCGGRCCR